MSSEILIDVQGMTCNSCVNHVGAALRKLAGVVSAEVKLEEGVARVLFDATVVTPADLVNAVVEEGYQGLPRAAHAV